MTAPPGAATGRRHRTQSPARDPAGHLCEPGLCATNRRAAQQLDTVVVTGIRASLLSSATDKKNAIEFVDTINAEDMGKFPDQNIAEAISRIPV